MKALSEEKIAEFRCAFELFDKDKDGTITIKELGAVISNLGQNASEKDLKEMIAEVDDNGNGEIDFTEFLALMSSKMRDNDTEEEMHEAFKVFNKSGSGYVTKKDLEQVMEVLGEKLTPEEIEEIMKDWDDDGDGQLNFDEFRNMMTFR